MSDYAYKPALLVGTLHYTLGDSHLICADKTGAEKWRLDWGQILSTAFVEHKIKSTRLRRLDLHGDSKRSISYTGGPGNPAHDPDAVIHLDLMVAILSRLDAEFPVSVGEYGRSRLAIFSVGAMSMAGAIVMLAFALGTGLSADRLGAAAVPLGLLFLLGATFAWTNAPWRPVPRIPAGILAKTLALIAHPATVSPSQHDSNVNLP